MNIKAVWFCHTCQKHGAAFYHSRMSVDAFLYQFKASHERESPNCDSKSVVVALRFDAAEHCLHTDPPSALVSAGNSENSASA